MALSVKLEAFEGPLDLLLHLIDKNKIDIYDIPIVMITDQYMEYLNAMQTQDLNVMSEFLVMAATLLDIKSKMLLPKQEEEEIAEEDPRAELVQRLLEYKIYKYMSYELKDRQFEAEKYFYGNKRLPKEVLAYEEPIDYENLVGDTTLAKLNELFEFVMKRQEDKVDKVRSNFGKIEKEEIDIEQKTVFIHAYIREHKRTSFRKLLEKQGSKQEVIVAFLVILEMMKTGEIEIVQKELFDDIEITLKN